MADGRRISGILDGVRSNPGLGVRRLSSSRSSSTGWSEDGLDDAREGPLSEASSISTSSLGFVPPAMVVSVDSFRGIGGRELSPSTMIL